MAPHSSVLAWRIPGTGEPGGLPSMGSHRVGHDCSDLAAAAALSRIGAQMWASALCPGLEAQFPAGPREERGCGPLTGKDRAAAKSLQSCPTLCDPTDGSPLGSPDPGILQARTLEWVAISFSSAQRLPEKLPEVTGTSRGNPEFPEVTRLGEPRPALPSF